ncbi:hypothetical protein LLS1_06990 [Leifsonia sp. LS1]|uniref:hypothetical protein n=1 Tax=Leifsonia sp. LS1 TaxID=2828483 RepID=UPI001CFD3DC3|nr:hypothetical protein [Leifsonia sp. LS1]GIT79030.1 hypothetical protein LLS1_06990 [Leifsonia sp. LS1]
MTRVDDLRRFGGRGVGAFGGMLVIGLGITALSLPIVTIVPALAAGTRHLDEHVSAKRDSVRELASLGWAAIRGGWLFGTIAAAVVALLLLNVVLGVEGLVPGGGVLAAVSGALAVVAAVTVGRVAARWQPGARWSQLWRRHRTDAITDPVGSLFVVAGLLVAVTVVWMLPPLIVIAPGLVAVALVAAERRRRAAAQEGHE